jgi:hypothetical protein
MVILIYIPRKERERCNLGLFMSSDSDPFWKSRRDIGLCFENSACDVYSTKYVAD